MNTNEIWFQKYRPSTLDDMILSDENRKIIESYGKNIPNLLFCGRPGTGKTTVAKIIVKDILQCDYLYINASDENGIDTIREKVIGFAQTMSFSDGLKVVILDEADFLSKAGQAALRNVMEEYSNTTRFILTGNAIHKITTPIRSRCQPIDLSLDIKSMFARCLRILSSEKIKVSQDQKKALLQMIQRNFPDMRKCINEMEKFSIDGELQITTKNNTNELCEKIFEGIKSGKTLPLRKYIIENEDLFDSDYENLLKGLLNHYYTSKLGDTEKKQSILTIADHLYKMVHVTDHEICFFACILALEA